MTNPQGAAVVLTDVTKSFAEHRALDGVNLAVEPGEFIALLGPSGCGKTTALRALAGLENVDAGSIHIDGKDATDAPANKRDLGMVFQSYSLFPHMTAAENVEFGLRMRRVGAEDRRRRAAAALKMVGLDGHSDRYSHEQSGGQQQRVALARALVTEPRVLLLDEPLSALDAKVRVQLRDEIRRIQTELGITTIFVTHDQEEALAVADRVAVMRDGRIEQIGTPEELYRRPATPFVAQFVGLSNRVAGTVEGDTVLVLGQRLPLLEPSTTPDGPASVLIRPEDITLAAPDSSDAGLLRGRVLSTSFLGSLRRSQIQLADGTVLAVQHPVRDDPAPGAEVALALARVPVAVADTDMANVAVESSQS